MIKNNTFFYSVLPFCCIIIILLILRVQNSISPPLFNSLFWGFFIPLLNSTTGHFLKEAGLKKSDNSFLLLVLGGMVFRMFLTLILIILVLQFLNVSLHSFIFTVFISYIYFLIIEIVYLPGKSAGK